MSYSIIEMSKQLICNPCNYKTKRSDNYARHLKSTLHNKILNNNKSECIKIITKNFKIICNLCNEKLIDKKEAMSHKTDIIHITNKNNFIENIKMMNLTDCQIREEIKNRGFELIN